MKIIDTCNNFACAGHLKAHYESNGIHDYQIIPLAVSLSTGNISELNNERIDSLLAAANGGSVVRIWSSRKDAEDYLTLLFICDLLKTKTQNIHVIFTTDLDGSLVSPNSINDSQIDALLGHEKALSPDGIASYSAEWQKLAAANSELRVLENGTITNKNYSDYDSLILNELAQLEPCTPATLIAKMLASHIIDGANDETYSLLVSRLIDNGIVQRSSNQITRH